MAVRRLGATSLRDSRSDAVLKTLIRNELKDLINNSIHEYLQKNKVPVATIDINVDKDCNQGHSHRDPSRGLRLNICGSSMDISGDCEKEFDDKVVTADNDDNLHWMTWRTSDSGPCRAKSYDVLLGQCQTPNSAHRYRCSSPFARPNTAASRYIDDEDSKDRSKNYGHNTARQRDTPRLARSRSAMPMVKPTTSVAVGPDRHYEDTSTNTHTSYQVSDYLKKNMNLNDPYERSVYSTLMEVMRSKGRQRCEGDPGLGVSDPIVQISEYKHKYQNPRQKITFPTSSTQTLVTVKKPPICPHKSRLFGQSRTLLSSTPEFRSGEQFLF